MECISLVTDPDFLNVDDVTSADSQSIYPNPASTHINIQTENTPLGDVRIYNILGQEVLHTTTQKISLQINTSALPSGVYFVQTAVTTQRIIVQ
jgi:hypothetical protein